MRFSMLFYVVPVAPGRSRFFAGYATDVLPLAMAGGYAQRSKQLGSKARPWSEGGSTKCSGCCNWAQSGLACRDWPAARSPCPACPCFNIAGLLEPLEPLMHSFQFIADLAAHAVIDGDAVHIAWQVRMNLVNAAAWAVRRLACRNCKLSLL